MNAVKRRNIFRRWAFLLRPAWLALFVVVIAFAYLCFTVLAPWQLGKNTKTSRENAQISNSLTAEPVPMTTFLPHQDSSAPDAQWRRVTATGHYLPDTQVLARLRKAELEEPIGKQQADYVIVNDQLDQTVDEMLAIIDRERGRDQSAR